MKENEIIKAFEDLAKSQGYYGRLLNYLKDLKDSDREEYDNIMKDWESHNFTDIVDLIMYIEG